MTGLDDPSSILDTTPDVATPPSPPLDPPIVVDLTVSAARCMSPLKHLSDQFQEPTPARPTRLKRRVVGSATSETLGSNIFTLGIDEPSEQPPLKRFKALFDASDPGRTGASAFDENALGEQVRSATLGGSQTQSQTQIASRANRSFGSDTNANLSILREEEEESQSGAGPVGGQRGTKRSLEDGDGDLEIADAESATLTSGAGPGPRKLKKRAVENANAIEKIADKTKRAVVGKPLSTTNIAKTVKGGAPPGQPDKDAAFLKAIASTKRGKRAEDEFDRDFNELKISKPDLVREELEEWAVLEEFGDETNVRGNFMVVVEMAVFNNGGGARKTRDAVLEWRGKPNFKKFKKACEISLC